MVFIGNKILKLWFKEIVIKLNIEVVKELIWVEWKNLYKVVFINVLN